VFAAVADQAKTVPELARELNVSAGGLELLLESLCGLGSLRRRKDRYELAKRDRPWLDPKSPTSIARYIAYNEVQWEWWSSLENVIRTGQGPAIHAFAPDDARWDGYMEAMFEMARLIEPEVTPRIPLPKGARTLVDLGGGHGLFADRLCERHPTLGATVVDLAGASRAGRNVLLQHNASSRVRHEPGDARTAELGNEVDGALVFQLLHHLQPGEKTALLRRIHSALRPGGALAVLELCRPPRTARPDSTALVALHFFLSSSASAHAPSDIEGWIRGAGFTSVKSYPIRRFPLARLFVSVKAP
jgi:SAM-dependent methyltransferase